MSAEPGVYPPTSRRPDLFENYLNAADRPDYEKKSTARSLRSPVGQPESRCTFAMNAEEGGSVPHDGALTFPLRRCVRRADLATTNDDIVMVYGFQATRRWIKDRWHVYRTT